MENLYRARKGLQLTVVRTPDIELLKGIGLHAGRKVQVQSRYALGGPVLLKVEGAYVIAIGKDVAEQIIVQMPTAEGTKYE